VLFYGQFVPLQGTLVLLDAIKLWEDSQYCRVDWVIIGRGQESSEFDRRLKQHNVPAIKRIEWVEYEELPAYIAAADVCLGIFGASQKALSVIPNKVYQILAVGRPLLTARTPGIQSLLNPSSAIELVMPNSPAAIVKGLRELSHRLATRPEEVHKETNQMPIVDSQQVGQQLAYVLLETASRKQKD
jgi:glycosyltransferase involved in cell wall biosynthesis